MGNNFWEKNIVDNKKKCPKKDEKQRVAYSERKLWWGGVDLRGSVCPGGLYL